ncbi:MAG: type II toxin-antitoxin system RelE/ParE family toxin [Ktedonobacteraceae bacterium]
MRQWRNSSQDYKERAGADIAERFITAVEEAVQFIQQHPYACALYEPGEGYEDIRAYQFRKWRLRGFPYVLLFRMRENATIFIEMLYAQKMDIPSYLMKDRE